MKLATHNDSQIRTAPVGKPGRSRLEWPTILIALAIYAGFAAMTWFYHDLPWWLIVPGAAYLVAWHGSLQHETIHGHPTPSRRVNELIVFPSLWLWLPYRVYRATHIGHHHDQRLTDPLDDPESYYWTARHWNRCHPCLRTFLWIRNTAAGRLILGPVLAVWQLYASQIPRLLSGERAALKAWALHVLGCAVVLYWVTGICGIPVFQYVLIFAYPGTALTLLRSFVEHQAAAVPGERSVIVEAAWPMALLYLNNNLHALHHSQPWLPWYRLSQTYGEQRRNVLAANGNYRFSGYGEILARYLLWPKEPPVHPGDHSRVSGNDGPPPRVYRPAAAMRS